MSGRKSGHGNAPVGQSLAMLCVVCTRSARTPGGGDDDDDRKILPRCQKIHKHNPLSSSGRRPHCRGTNVGEKREKNVDLSNVGESARRPTSDLVRTGTLQRPSAALIYAVDALALAVW